MDKRGQAAVEYALVLVAFTAAAIGGWHVLRPALGGIYENICTQRGGLRGMRP